MNGSAVDDWERFTQALARCLWELPSRATLVISASGNRYVQFVQFDIRLTAELAGNDFLREPISPANAATLRELGWQEPSPRRDVENWNRSVLWPMSRGTVVEFARSVVFGLREALGVAAPGELRATGWAENNGSLDLTVLGGIGRREPPDRHHARG